MQSRSAGPLVTPENARVMVLVAEWSFAARMGSLQPDDVAAIAA